VRRIGDILLAHGWVDPKVLERAVARPRGQRLCSFLVDNDAVTADNAARALGEEHGVPAALERHLANREPALAKLIPAGVAREHCVLPIGRSGARDLIVCARDPKPSLRGLIETLTGERVVLAVALASRLEPLVADTYGVPTEFDVDLTTGPIVSLDDELEGLSGDAVTEEEVTEEKPAGEPLAALDSLTLVELDDTRVSRDLSQSGVIQIGPQVREKLPIGESRPAIVLPPVVGRTPTSEPAISRTSTARTSLMAVAHPTAGAPPPPSAGLASGTVLPTRASRPAIATRGSIDVPSVEQLLDKAIQVAAERWQAVLLLSIKGRLALGHRGHGSQLGEDVVRGVAIPLAQASIIKAAFETGRIVTKIPDETGAVQDRLERLLSMPRFPAAMPIATGGSVTFILAVGDPIAGAPDAAARELERLGNEFAAALARLAVT
jgi:hypothetical protein